MTPEDKFRFLVQETANRLLALLEEANVQPTHEVCAAMLLIFAVASKQGSVDKDAYMAICSDAYDNAELYFKEENK